MDIENAIRGTLKVFGLRLGCVTKLTFETRALELLAHQPRLAAIAQPLLRVRQVLRTELARLSRMVLQLVREDPVCRHLMGVPRRRPDRCADLF